MALTNSKTAKQCADALSGIAEPHRIQIIDILRTGPKNVTEIAKSLKIEIVNASHHLSVLRNAGLVETKKDGRFVIYSLDPKFSDSKSGLTLDLGWCKVVVG
jgi:DNA-binding transcriptional ArsR family regulator